MTCGHDRGEMVGRVGFDVFQTGVSVGGLLGLDVGLLLLGIRSGGGGGSGSGVCLVVFRGLVLAANEWDGSAEPRSTSNTASLGRLCGSRVGCLSCGLGFRGGKVDILASVCRLTSGRGGGSSVGSDTARDRAEGVGGRAILRGVCYGC